MRAAWSTRGRPLDGRRRAADGEPVRRSPRSSCSSCSGYYRYDEGYTPDFPGLERFAGPIVHPQHWPDGPRLRRQEGRGHRQRRHRGDPGAGDGRAGRARHDAAALADLHRCSLPAQRPARPTLRRLLPDAAAATRSPAGRTSLLQHGLLPLCRRRPAACMKPLLRKASIAQLPAGYDVDTHFTPRYDPWDQRMCLVPDGDLFAAIRAAARPPSSPTGSRRFTETGIRLGIGRASSRPTSSSPRPGSSCQLLGGIELDVDGEPVDPADTIVYKGDDARRRAELRLRLRLHERVLDAQGRPGLPSTSCRLLKLHGRATVRRVRPGQRDPTRSRPWPMLDFHPATSSARSASSRSRARGGRGGCG